MKIHDVSLTLTSHMVTWPSDPKIILERVEKIEDGAMANVSRLDMGVHTGTHIDAPIHFVPGGMAIDAIPLDVLIGSACVIEIPDSVATITKAVLEKIEVPIQCKRILFKTPNSQIWARGDQNFHKDFVALSEDAADFLVSRGVQLVGIDYLSIAPYNQPRPTHEAFLKAKVIVIEGLDFSKVGPGVYQLFCLPIKLGGSDGAPARVVLIED